MPYITQDKRDVLDSTINQLHRLLVGLESDDENNNTEGNLNYVITRLLQMCYGTSYREINDAIGMLECCKLEFYRKVAAPYEDQKEFENGTIESNKSTTFLTETLVETNDGC